VLRRSLVGVELPSSRQTFNKEANMLNIKLSHLILLYCIIPVALIAVWVDQSLLDGALLKSFPFRPESWLLWIYLFGMPHVIMGMQMFADKEYLQAYGWRLLRILVTCLVLPPVVIALFGDDYLFAIFMGFIVYHTVAQQMGLTLVALKKSPDFFFYVWKWAAVGIGAILYVMMYWRFPMALIDRYGLREPLMMVGLWLLVVGVFAAGVMMWRNRANRLGVVYIAANVALIGADCLLFYMHYFFLVVVMGRIIHEFTAWPIYIAHDHNRNRVVVHNWLYRVFKGVGPVGMVSLVIAFAVGFAVQYTASVVPFVTSVVVSLSIYHYYTEHFLWRRGGLLRMNVGFLR
jgi:hypothetical protein